LLQTGNLQFLAIFYNLAANEHGLWPKASKISINAPKLSIFFLILLDFPCFLLIIQLLLIAKCYEKTTTLQNQKWLNN